MELTRLPHRVWGSGQWNRAFMFFNESTSVPTTPPKRKSNPNTNIQLTKLLSLMYFPKKYGQSKTAKCPFCDKISTTKNKLQIPVCSNHKNAELKDLKCTCGGWLDLKIGKFGPYFNCIECGNVSWDKAMHMNKILDNQAKPNEQVNAKPNYKAIKETKKEITITSDELDFYYL